jgi:hypothetical protein
MPSKTGSSKSRNLSSSQRNLVDLDMSQLASEYRIVTNMIREANQLPTSASIPRT